MNGHLSVERISVLLDEPWADLEAQGHLERCDACRAEFERLSRMRMALSAMGEIEPPLGQWAAIDAALDRAGVGVRRRAAGGIARRFATSGPLQAAAAIALFAGGVVAGLQFTGAGVGAGNSGGGPPAVLTASGDDRALMDGLSQLESLGAGAPLRTVGIDGIGGVDARYGNAPMAAVERAVRLEVLIKKMRERLEADPADPFANAFLLEYVEEQARLAEELERFSRAQRTITW